LDQRVVYMVYNVLSYIAQAYGEQSSSGKHLNLLYLKSISTK